MLAAVPSWIILNQTLIPGDAIEGRLSMVVEISLALLISLCLFCFGTGVLVATAIQAGIFAFGKG